MNERLAKMADELIDALDGPEMVQIGWVVLAWPASMTPSEGGRTLLLRLPALVEQEVIDDYMDSLEGVVPDDVEIEDRRLEKAAWVSLRAVSMSPWCRRRRYNSAPPAPPCPPTTHSVTPPTTPHPPGRKGGPET